MNAWSKAREDAIWWAYCSAISGAIFMPGAGGVNSDEVGAAVALGAIHGRLGEGFPLSRPALLAEVAGLCGEADADPVGEALVRADERGKVLDALEAWRVATVRPSLAEWIDEQRKAVAR